MNDVPSGAPTGPHPGLPAPGPSDPRSLFAVADKTAVVTGAASGLGFAMARVLARNGARVVLADAQADTLASATAALAAEGADVRSALVDVRHADAVSEAMTAAGGDTAGRGLDIVIANAGISAGLGRHFGNDLDTIDLERWQAVLDVNLTGVLHTVRAGAARMNDGGRIVITGSVAGLDTDALVGYAYSSAKAAVTLLARNLAAELAARSICVNVIAPGSFLTEIGRRNPGNEGMLTELRRATALGRLADPAEIEGLTLLLCSAASSFITGAVHTIDGGVGVTRR